MIKILKYLWFLLFAISSLPVFLIFGSVYLLDKLFDLSISNAKEIYSELKTIFCFHYYEIVPHNLLNPITRDVYQIQISTCQKCGKHHDGNKLIFNNFFKDCYNGIIK